MAHVSIGRRFLSEVRSQYQDWQAAYVREALQNCVDAPRTKNVHFLIYRDGSNTCVSFSNDGSPMSQEELTDKLLTLGETGKDHSGTVGGFGRAKELLYFCHENYKVESGGYCVSGSGCEYEMHPMPSYSHGTRSSVVIEGDHVEELSAALRKCVGYSYFKGEVTLNGIPIEERTRRGHNRNWEDGEGWCTVYTNRQHEGIMLVRVGGVFMFSRKLWDYKGTVVCELNSSYRTLTSNRDGLRSEFQYALDAFVESISTNRRSAFKPKSPKYRRYIGTKLAAPVTRTFKVEPKIVTANAPAEWVAQTKHARLEAAKQTVAGVARGEIETSLNSFETAVVLSGEVAPADEPSVTLPILEAAEPVADPEEATLAYGGFVAVKHDFMLRNELNHSVKVPVYYDPGSEKFSSYAQWLTTVWAKCMVELHAMFERSSAFSIGFIFDEPDEEEGFALEGLHEEHEEVGDIYYISPCVYGEKSNGTATFSRRWNKSDRWEILAVAAHEFVHGEGHERHNEKYANRLTDVFAEVVKNRNRFNHCFKV